MKNLNASLGIDDSWAQSDGIVNIRGVEPPEGMTSVKWEDGMTVEPGVWHVMPLEVRDHQSWIGMAMETDEYYRYFDEMLKKFAELD